MKYKVVVISPNPYSRYTLSTLYLLERQDIQVTAVISLKMLNMDRIFKEFKRDGFRLLRKIYRKLILRTSENPVSGTDNIVSFMEESEMPLIPVPAYCKKHGIEYFATSDLNNKKVHSFLDKHKPDCIPFTGGGLIRQSVIDRAGKGVVNCHMGVLPYYRGMDVVQWPICNKDFDNIGMTTHIMDEGVDTGDILSVIKVNSVSHDNLKSLRNSFERLMPQVLVEGCSGLLSGDIKLRPQMAEDGIQHFIMNKRLSPMIDSYLQQQ